MTTTNNIYITLSSLIILSYLFNILSKYIKIPSVIFLLSTGIIGKILLDRIGYQLENTAFILELFGSIGLILIVLEGSLDLSVTKSKLPLIGKSILASILILIATSGLIYSILYYILLMPFKEAIIYSIPMGVISSAIAIPSVANLSQSKKEFIVYESTFSDIIGIMVFNFAIADNALSSDSILHFFLNILYIILISIFSSGLLIFMLNSINTHIKSFLIFAILILIYSIGKIFHLPSLLLVLVFGIILNNLKFLIKGKIASILHIEKMHLVTSELKLLTAESSFLIRTFFFILFGYTMNLSLLTNLQTVFVGSLIVISILLARFIFLRFISKTHVIPELFIAPRGLVTIVLFYSIPATLISPIFDMGILYFVIIATGIIMMFGLMFTKSEFKEDSKLVIEKETN